MRRSDGTYCPLIKKNCIEYKCKFYQKLRGNDPQGGEIDEYDCAFIWQNILLIENSQMHRQTGAAVESLRNNMVDSARMLADVTLQLSKDN